MSTVPVLEPQETAPAEPTPRGLLRRVLTNPVGLVCSVVLLLVVLAGLLAPWLAPFDPNASRLELTNAPPFTSDFLLGGDQSGRDVLSRLLVATTGTLQAISVVLLVSLLLGVTGGLLAGYFGGKVDAVANWVSDIVLAAPGLVLLIALYTVIGPSILLAMAAFGVLVAPGFFRLVRSLVRNVRKELYVDAAQVAGLSDTRIISRHVLRAVRGPIVVQSAFVLAIGISIQAMLEFLGLGSPGEPSWGGMLEAAFNNIYVARSNVLWPALLIGVTTIALVLLGNVLRDTLQASASRPGPLPEDVVRRLRAARQTPPAAPGPDAQTAAGPAAPAPLLQVRGLVVGYPDSATSVREVVHGVDLAVERGEVHGLVGESGSGKSQIAYSILGILPREAVVLAGRIEFAGRDLVGDPAALRDARGRRIGYVPQEPMTNLDPTFTIGQQLTHGLRAVTDVSRRQAKEELVALLDRVGIRDPRGAFDLYPHQVSGGMAQRVLIAGALAGEPELIIADEPTTALDVTVQADVLELLRELQRERDLGMVLVTHNLGVVADICDRVSVMKEGRIVETRPVRELFAAPEHEYTQMLLGSTLDRGQLRAPLAPATGGR
ncbi:dipeptide/oligopeptide/nickel ABC transporter permease/ATP-binding protein [Modestobacter roseus]|uniref:Peptide/nickel transport system permease protein n=1 Tax=Modestobacter roseus TaxID=1181884 RepID=A0A562IRS2_9ACTN|nr:dipeptide/oligopeptide/nickel ABC transporter permease/ATP-binding protein [Modestobacter roseus]TWH73264.1 peptide/nickel transport system permease protein [Modestobacter roseus]